MSHYEILTDIEAANIKSRPGAAQATASNPVITLLPSALAQYAMGIRDNYVNGKGEFKIAAVEGTIFHCDRMFLANVSQEISNAVKQNPSIKIFPTAIDPLALKSWLDYTHGVLKQINWATSLMVICVAEIMKASPPRDLFQYALQAPAEIIIKAATKSKYMHGALKKFLIDDRHESIEWVLWFKQSRLTPENYNEMRKIITDSGVNECQLAIADLMMFILFAEYSFVHLYPNTVVDESIRLLRNPDPSNYWSRALEAMSKWRTMKSICEVPSLPPYLGKIAENIKCIQCVTSDA